MISIIIPTYNEAQELSKLLPYLLDCCGKNPIQIIVADAGSVDETEAICKKLCVTYTCCAAKNRAIQMNAGAGLATADILYFVHADTQPPADFLQKILSQVQKGYKAGRFKTKFDSPSFLLKMNAFFTRFDWMMCYGGDQTLFIDRKTYFEMEGYNEGLAIMEDYEFTERIKQRTSYVIMPGKVLVSARKYQHNSWWSVQHANYVAVKAYKKKTDSNEIKKAYYSKLKTHL